MVKWSGSKKKPFTLEERRRLLREEKAQRKKRAHKQAIKDKLDLYGEGSLNWEEKEIVRLFPGFFYPPQGSQK